MQVTQSFLHFTSINTVTGFLPDQSVSYLWLSLWTVQLETLQNSANVMHQEQFYSAGNQTQSLFGFTSGNYTIK